MDSTVKSNPHYKSNSNDFKSNLSSDTSPFEIKNTRLTDYNTRESNLQQDENYHQMPSGLGIPVPGKQLGEALEDFARSRQLKFSFKKFSEGV